MRSLIYSCNIDELPLVINFHQIFSVLAKSLESTIVLFRELLIVHRNKIVNSQQDLTIYHCPSPAVSATVFFLFFQLIFPAPHYPSIYSRLSSLDLSLPP